MSEDQTPTHPFRVAAVRTGEATTLFLTTEDRWVPWDKPSAPSLTRYFDKLSDAEAAVRSKQLTMPTRIIRVEYVC